MVPQNVREFPRPSRFPSRYTVGRIKYKSSTQKQVHGDHSSMAAPARKLKQLKCLSADENVVSPDGGILFSRKKEQGAGTCFGVEGPESITLTERRGPIPNGPIYKKRPEAANPETEGSVVAKVADGGGREE